MTSDDLDELHDFIWKRRKRYSARDDRGPSRRVRFVADDNASLERSAEPPIHTRAGRHEDKICDEDGEQQRAEDNYRRHYRRRTGYESALGGYGEKGHRQDRPAERLNNTQFSAGALGLRRRDADLRLPSENAELAQATGRMLVPGDSLLGSDYILECRKRFDAATPSQLRTMITDRGFAIANAPSLQIVVSLIDETLTYVKFHYQHEVPVNYGDPYLYHIDSLRYALFRKLSAGRLSCLLHDDENERQQRVLHQLASRPFFGPQARDATHQTPISAFDGPLQRAMAITAAFARVIAILRRRPVQLTSAGRRLPQYLTQDLDPTGAVSRYRPGLVTELVLSELRTHQCNDQECRSKLTRLLRPYRLALLFCPFDDDNNNGPDVGSRPRRPNLAIVDVDCRTRDFGTKRRHREEPSTASTTVDVRVRAKTIARRDRTPSSDRKRLKGKTATGENEVQTHPSPLNRPESISPPELSSQPRREAESNTETKSPASSKIKPRAAPRSRIRSETHSSSDTDDDVDLFRHQSLDEISDQSGWTSSNGETTVDDTWLSCLLPSTQPDPPVTPDEFQSHDSEQNMSTKTVDPPPVDSEGEEEMAVMEYETCYSEMDDDAED